MRRALRWFLRLACGLAVLIVLFMVALTVFFLPQARSAFSGGGMSGPSAPSLTIIVVDEASGQPLSGVQGYLSKHTKNLLSPTSYDSQHLTGKSDSSGTLELRGEEPIRGVYRLDLRLPGYVPYLVTFAFERPEPMRISLKPKHPAGAVASVVRGSQRRRDKDDLTPGGPDEEPLEVGFSLSTARFTTGDEPAELIFRSHRFPDHKAKEEYVRQGSILSSYSTKTNRDGTVKLLVELAVPPGGKIQHMPKRQWCSYHELDRCTFDRSSEVISLFGPPSRTDLERSDLFCLRTPTGRVAKIRVSTADDFDWALQSDGSSFVGTIPLPGRGEALCDDGRSPRPLAGRVGRNFNRGLRPASRLQR